MRFKIFFDSSHVLRIVWKVLRSLPAAQRISETIKTIQEKQSNNKNFWSWQRPCLKDLSHLKIYLFEHLRHSNVIVRHVSRTRAPSYVTLLNYSSSCSVSWVLLSYYLFYSKVGYLIDWDQGWPMSKFKIRNSHFWGHWLVNQVFSLAFE